MVGMPLIAVTDRTFIETPYFLFLTFLESSQPDLVNILCLASIDLIMFELDCHYILIINTFYTSTEYDWFT